MRAHTSRANLSASDSSSRALKRDQPVQLVTVALGERLIPLAFIPKKKSQILDTTAVSKLNALVSSSKTSTHMWNVIIGPHMAREEYNEAMNAFIKAVLEIDIVSYIMSHQREVSIDFVFNKLGYDVPALEDLPAWNPEFSPTTRKSKLVWDDCDCGCGCMKLMIGSIQFSREWVGQNFVLRIGGHGRMGRYLNSFGNKDAIDHVVLAETLGERKKMLQLLRMCGDI